MQRRQFLHTAAHSTLAVAAAGALPRPRARAKDLVNSRIAVCCTGVKGRGNGLFNGFGAAEGCDVKYVCDIDTDILAQRAGEFESRFGSKPERITDYRRALDDQGIDAIVLGTPDHWHALPTIHGCQAGKDVYVEKPDGHNLVEGQVMAAAAKKHGRIIQLGTQARSDPELLQLVDYVKQGVLGRVVMAKAWESSKQKNLGKPADGPAPPNVDYNVWLGPAPERPFNPLRFHGNWRWFFDYGAGDLANDGVHRLDQARWFLETAVAASGETMPQIPRKVSALGGKYFFDDAQEWPDTLMATYDYGGRLLSYEMRIWSAYPQDGEPEGAAIYGENGYLVVGGSRWRHFGPKGELIKEQARTKTGADAAHVKNFLDCMRSRAKPTADQETVGRISSLLCHLGNVAWRVGHTVEFDPETYQFTDADANQLRTRQEYRKPYVLPSLAEV